MVQELPSATGWWSRENLLQVMEETTSVQCHPSRVLLAEAKRKLGTLPFLLDVNG